MTSSFEGEYTNNTMSQMSDQVDQMALEDGTQRAKKRNLGTSMTPPPPAQAKPTIISIRVGVVEDKGSTIQSINNIIQAINANHPAISNVSYQSIIRNDEHKTAFFNVPTRAIADAIRPYMNRVLDIA